MQWPLPALKPRRSSLQWSCPHHCLVPSISSRPARPRWPSLQESLYHTESRSSHATKIMVCPWSTAICSLSVSSFPARTQCPSHPGLQGWEIKVGHASYSESRVRAEWHPFACDAPRCTANATHQLLMLSKEIAFPATWEICQQNKWIQINSGRRRTAILIHGFLSSVLLKWSLSSTQAAVINTSSPSCTLDYWEYTLCDFFWAEREKKKI